MISFVILKIVGVCVGGGPELAHALWFYSSAEKVQLRLLQRNIIELL